MSTVCPDCARLTSGDCGKHFTNVGSSWYPTWPFVYSTCEHCYCEAHWKDDHLACCKCATYMHKKFLPARSAESAAGEAL